MQTVLLKTGEIVPAADCDHVTSKLRTLYEKDFDALCDLLRSCRNPAYHMGNHPLSRGRQDLLVGLGLVESMSDFRASICPTTRAIILAAVSTALGPFPKLVSPLVEGAG